MDTSEQYIKMCDTEEVQSQRKRISEWDGKLWMFNEDGDFITNAKLARLGSERATRTTNGKNSPKLVWLPRQDQLQEMVGSGDKSFDIGLLFGKAFRFLMDGNCEYITSMEQLWLAFYMSEKYGKVWNGTGWVKRS